RRRRRQRSGQTAPHSCRDGVHRQAAEQVQTCRGRVGFVRSSATEQGRNRRGTQQKQGVIGFCIAARIGQTADSELGGCRHAQRAHHRETTARGVHVRVSTREQAEQHALGLLPSALHLHGGRPARNL